jgi:hypothetical protein
MLEACTRTDVLQLGLHHRAQVARRVMAEIDDTAGLALENDDHASANLGCWYSHNYEVAGLI